MATPIQTLRGGLRSSATAIADRTGNDQYLRDPLEVELERASMEAQQNGAFGQGIARSARGLKASVADLYGTAEEAYGSPQAAEQAYTFANRQRNLGAASSPDVPTWADASTPAEYARFAAGAMANGLTSMAPTLAAAYLSKGLPIGAAGRYAVTAAPSVVPMAGETAAALRNDPVAADLSAKERLGLSVAGGVGGAVAEAAVPHFIANRTGGVKKLSSDLVKAHVGEGLSEVASSELNRGIVSSVNPDRDTSGDAASRMEEFMGGVFGAAPVATPATIAGSVYNEGKDAAGNAVNAVRSGMPDVLSAMRDRAGQAFDAGRNLATGTSAEDLGVVVGKGAKKVVDAKDKLVGMLDRKLVQGANADLDTLLAPQQAPAGVDPISWIRQDDAVRNESAKRLAAEYLGNPDVPASVQQAARNALERNDNSPALWAEFGTAAQNYERAKKFSTDLDLASARFHEAGIAVGKTARAIKDGVTKGRQNAMSVTEDDPFNDLFTKTFFEYAAPNTDGDNTEQLIKAAQVTPQLRTWVTNGFSATPGGDVFMPAEIVNLLGPDPQATVTALHTLAERQGLLDEEGSATRLSAALAAIDDVVEADNIVENNLLPTAQAKYNFSGSDHREITMAIERMIETGEFNDAVLDELFGANKDKVLAALDKQKEQAEQAKRNEILDSDGVNPDDENTDDVIAGMTNAIAPNEIKSTVEWHGPYDLSKGETVSAGLAKKRKELDSTGKAVREMGLIDKIREDYDGDIQAERDAISDAVAKYSHVLEAGEGARPEEAINKKVRVVKSEDASDKIEAIDVPGSDFDSVQPGSKWALSEGRNKEYGTVEHGRIWFEKVNYNSVDKESGAYRAIPFNTSAAKIITRMREAQKDIGGERKYGLAGQREMLLQGISSLLNSRNGDGSSTLSGNIGIKMSASSPVQWIQAGNEKAVKKLIGQLKMFGDTLADVDKEAAATLATKNRDELTKWVEQNSRFKSLNVNKDQQEWTKKDEDQLKVDMHELSNGKMVKGTKRKVRKENIVRQAKARREMARLVTAAREALLAKDDARIAKALRTVVDDSGDANDAPLVSKSTYKKRVPEITAESLELAGMRIVEPATDTYVDSKGRVRQGAENEYDVSTPSEELAYIEAANKEYMESPKDFDELTGEEKQPRLSRDEREAAKVALQNSLPSKEQVTWTLDTLRKGIPAFSAAVSKLSAERVAALRKTLGAMLEAKTADNPIWRGNAPKDMEAFTKRARVALNSLEKAGIRENAQSAESPKAEKEMPRAERDALRAEIVKSLGNDIAVEFKRKLLGDNGVEISGDWQEGLIRISLRAEDPAGVGAHEAMHEFFNRLLKAEGNKGAERVHEILINAANSKPVVRQIERLLHKHPNALAQIKDGAENFQEERLAYAYQFYRAGLLTVGAETKTTFQKIADLFRWAVGRMTDVQKAERLFDAFAAGETQTADAAAQVLAENIEYRERLLNGAIATVKPIIDKVNSLVEPAQDVLLDSGNPALERILKKFKQPTGEGVEETYYEAQQRMTAKYINQFDRIVSKYQPKDLELAAEYLHKGTPPTDAVALEIYNGVRSLLDEMDSYVREAGVKRWDPDAKDGKGEWLDMGRRENYYPRAYDIAAISADADGFINDLMSEPRHLRELENIAKAANKELDEGEAKPDSYASAIEKSKRKAGAEASSVTARDVATAITNRILNSFGQSDVQETESAVGFEPFMNAVNRRQLDWLNADHMSKWLNKDMADIITSYVAQSVKRAEYVRRFENGGTQLQRLMDDALKYEVDKIMAEDEEIEKREAVNQALKKLEQPTKALMALEGTLGYDVPPALRKIGGVVVAYENLRLLSTALFSQMIDPLGIVVRGGEMKDAWAAYKRGMKEVYASWTGKRNTDVETKLAEEIGTVEAAGFLATFGQQYTSMYLGQKVRKVNDALFKYNGMEGFNRAARIQATQAAIGFLKRHKSLPEGDISKEYLSELRLTPADIVVNEDGSINYNDPKIAFAIKRWVDGAILRPNAAQRSVWMSDPHYMMFAHMKQFAYSMHDVILKRVMKEAKHHDNMVPLAVVASFVPMMIAADTTKSLMLTGDAPIWSHDLGETIMHGANRAGLAGMYQPFVDVAVAGHGAATLAGPAAEQVTQLFTQPISESLKEALPGANVINVVSK